MRPLLKLLTGLASGSTNRATATTTPQRRQGPTASNHPQLVRTASPGQSQTPLLPLRMLSPFGCSLPTETDSREPGPPLEFVASDDLADCLPDAPSRYRSEDYDLCVCGDERRSHGVDGVHGCRICSGGPVQYRCQDFVLDQLAEETP